MAGCEALEATETLASLYQLSRLYINFFQPSFKLKSKTRHGAKVTERYEAPLTPLEPFRYTDLDRRAPVAKNGSGANRRSQ
jgi:hypothetical protein